MSGLSNTLMAYIFKINRALTQAGDWLSMLILRIFIGYEYFDSGLEKYNGQNWFKDPLSSSDKLPVNDTFPLPFNLFSADFNWFIATWFELIGGIALIIGLFTRFFSFSLFILTIVALVTVHLGPDCGYSFLGCGYKFVVIFLIMTFILTLSGAGKASIDRILYNKFK